MPSQSFHQCSESETTHAQLCHRLMRTGCRTNTSGCKLDPSGRETTGETRMLSAVPYVSTPEDPVFTTRCVQGYDAARMITSRFPRDTGVLPLPSTGFSRFLWEVAMRRDGQRWLDHRKSSRPTQSRFAECCGSLCSSFCTTAGHQVNISVAATCRVGGIDVRDSPVLPASTA